MTNIMGIAIAVTIFGFFHCFSGFVLSEERALVQDPTTGKWLVVISKRDSDGECTDCSISTDPGVIEEEQKKAGDATIFRPSVEEMEAVRKECTSLSRRRRNVEVEREEEVLDGPPATEATDGWNIIFPGTKWCGAGDVAQNDDDLGFHEDTDRCCRAHDKCDDLMEAGETKNNLTNKSPFTALSCQCDHDFYDCLSRINSMISNTVGNSYFNALRRPCYEQDYPLSKKCKKYRTFLKITCQEYERDTTKPQVYQWVKAKVYKQLPIPGPIDITLPF